MKIVMENTDAMERVREALVALGDNRSMRQVGEICAKHIRKIVPEKSGKLKNAYNINVSKGTATVTWDGPKAKSLKYAHYQFMGITYETNYPVYAKSGYGKKATYDHIGWTSSKEKSPTDRQLGTPYSFVKRFKNGSSTIVTVDGYSKAGSTAKWTEVARTEPTIYYPMRKEISDYLRERLKRRQTN